MISQRNRHAAERFDDAQLLVVERAIQKDTTSCTIKAHTTLSILVEINQSLLAQLIQGLPCTAWTISIGLHIN